MHLYSAAVFPRRDRTSAPALPGNPCPAGPIAFTRDVARADWIQAWIGMGERDERLSVLAQVVFLGLSPDGEIGFVARSVDGVIYRGWEDAALLSTGPCWAAAVTSKGSLALPIALHGRAFPLPLKARPFKRHVRATARR